LRIENPATAPHIHYHENTKVVMGDAILPMAAIYAMCFYYYGPRVLLLLVTSVFSSVAADVLCTLISGKRVNARDYSAIVTGMIIPLMMPASIPFHIAAIAAVFGITIVKHPFGGVGNNVFNPAAAGVAFAIVCFPVRMFTYPMPLETLPVFPDETLLQVSSPAFTLQLGGVPNYDFVDMSLGNFPGPMGATNILVILACLLYLVLRGAVRWEMPVAYLAVFAALCWAFPRDNMNAAQNILYDMMSGTVLFGGAFMLTDPVTTPQRAWAKAAYAALAGAAVFLFRRYSRYEEEFVFVLLIMNATVWGFDMVGERIAGIFRRKKFETLDDKKVQKKQ
jgi:electron transport complex protein RnfD